MTRTLAGRRAPQAAVRRRGITLVCSSVVVLAALKTTNCVHADEGPRQEQAAALVRSALEADLAGDAAKRDDLLASALEIDPDFPAAHWQRGEVRYGDEWRLVPEVAAEIAGDLLNEYNELRAATGDDPALHYEMARWCEEQGLVGHARFHWTKVLWADPASEEARAYLGLQEYNGGLYTVEQIAVFKQQAREAKRAFDRWLPTFMTHLRDAASDDSARREAALYAIRSLDDPTAIEALEYVIHERAPRRDSVVSRLGPQRAEALRRELNLAIVAALSNLPHFEATQRLAFYAVYSNWPEVRTLAAEGLRSRPPTDYVPLLMADLKGTKDVEYLVTPLGDGMVLTELVRQIGPETEFRHVRRTTFATIRLNPNPRLWQPVTFQGQAAGQAGQTAANVSADNELILARNQRVQSALAIVSGRELSPDPEIWWQAWADFNELYQDERDIYQTNQDNDIIVPMMSCFVAGTPVWTDAGPVPIEQIVPGDLVLSQNPDTGELAYRPVMQTTLRPPSPLVSLRVNGQTEETIVTTRGHRFWVEGHGWEMAKFLRPELSLHTLDHGAGVQEVTLHGEEKSEEAYNLVVDGFHTYFVGQSQLLVCDNSCPQPTLAVTPGLIREELRSVPSLGVEAVEAGGGQ
jgi:hypothetical protein